MRFVGSLAMKTRPHEALNQHTPASVYSARQRGIIRRACWQSSIPDNWQKRRVSSNGEIQVERRFDLCQPSVD